MVTVEKRKKWNYKDTSSQQFSKYVDKINSIHPTMTEQYPGQFQPGSLAQPLTHKQAVQQFAMQQAMQQAAVQAPMGAMMQMNPMLSQMNPMVGIPPVPTPISGFVGVPQYNPYMRH